MDLSPVLRRLYHGPRGDAPGVVNPYKEAFPELDGPAAKLMQSTPGESR